MMNREIIALPVSPETPERNAGCQYEKSFWVEKSKEERMLGLTFLAAHNPVKNMSETRVVMLGNNHPSSPEAKR